MIGLSEDGVPVAYDGDERGHEDETRPLCRFCGEAIPARPRAVWRFCCRKPDCRAALYAAIGELLQEELHAPRS